MQSVSAGTLLLGAGLALFWAAFTERLLGAPLTMRRPITLVVLVARVIADMVRSNLHVAWATLARRQGDVRPGFVAIPLEIRGPNAQAALSIIITFTPGTAWAQLSADRRTLLIHVFDLRDEETTAQHIKDRYERLLREIFE
jgi:multicomponent K+:H+ antiporter subunit E